MIACYETCDRSNVTVLSRSGQRDLVVTRLFDGPRELVYDAFTRPELLRRWYFGDYGWSLRLCQVELHAGGSFRFVRRHRVTGQDVDVRGLFHAVSAERIVASEMCDTTGGATLSTLEFTDEDGGTRLTQRIRYASREARDEAIRSGMARRLAEGYDRLDAVLARLMS